MEMKSHDFWFAINNTEVVMMPQSRLQTFGSTNLHYHLVSELMDTVNKIRVREGTIRSKRPEIILPNFDDNEFLEGFGEEARQYVDWMKSHAHDFFVLQYGFKIQKRDISEHIVSGNVQEVLDTVKKSVKEKDDPSSSVILGVDDPWDVCLLKLMFDLIQQSAPMNFKDIKRRRLLDDINGLPRMVREAIEEAFLHASKDSSKMNNLMGLLQKHGVFEEYQDRFFALVRQHAG
jgi:hypothetical protein